MGKSANGPDWVDVLMYVRALDTLHGCITGICIVASPGPRGEVAMVTIMSNWDALPNGNGIQNVVTEKRITAAELVQLSSIVYNGLYTHDFAIGQAYQQRNLPGA